MKRFGVALIAALALSALGCTSPDAEKYRAEVAAINAGGGKLLLTPPGTVTALTIPAKEEGGATAALPLMFAVSHVVEANDREVLVEQAGGKDKGKRFWVEKRFLMRHNGALKPVYSESLKESATEYRVN